MTTHTGHGLLWYGTIPAFFTTMAGIGWLLYQYFAFQDSPLFGEQHHYFETFAAIAREYLFAGGGLTWLTITGIAVAVLGFLLVPPFCEAAVIGLAAAKKRGKQVTGSDGIAVGFAYFLRMFEYRAVMSVFSFVEWFTLVSIATRHFGMSTPFLVLFTLLLILSVLFYLLFVYGDNFIVLEDQPVMGALTGSAKLVGGNLKETLLMSILLLLVFIRTIINVLLLFLIPVLVTVVTGFFVSKAALFVGIILGSLVGLVAFVLAAYLAGTLTVFTTTAWTLTFLSLDRKRTEHILAE